MAGKKRKKRKLTPTPSLVEMEKDYGIFEDYIQYGPQYDTVNGCPIIPEETEVVQRISFKKLSHETRKLLRSVMEDLVLDYWNNERQIPFGGTLNKMRATAIREVYSYTGQYAKDNDELKHHLNECVPVIINKELRNGQDKGKCPAKEKAE